MESSKNPSESFGKVLRFLLSLFLAEGLGRILGPLIDSSFEPVRTPEQYLSIMSILDKERVPGSLYKVAKIRPSLLGRYCAFS